MPEADTSLNTATLPSETGPNPPDEKPQTARRTHNHSSAFFSGRVSNRRGLQRRCQSSSSSSAASSESSEDADSSGAESDGSANRRSVTSGPAGLLDAGELGCYIAYFFGALCGCESVILSVKIDCAHSCKNLQ